jgi:hypothetical protein
MPDVRPAAATDLDSLLALFRASEVSAYAEPKEHAERIWSQTLSWDGVAVFVSEAASRVVATCMLITAPTCCEVVVSMAFSKTSSRIPNIGGKATAAPLFMRPWLRRGRTTVTTSCYKAAAQILACIVSTNDAALSRGFGLAT